MVSGVGFKNTAEEEKQGAPRKHMVSRGLSVTAFFLVIILVAWGGLKMWENNLVKEVAGIKEETKSINMKIQTSLEDSDVSDFAVRASLLDGELYRGYTTNDILNEIESIMIRKDSDASGSRIVLKSFEHSAGVNKKRTVGDVDAIITGQGNITISADADTFDVMAQQIEEFKNSKFFSNVAVGTTDRDDSGRIIFTLTMDVQGYDKSSYESYEMTGAAPTPVVENNDVTVKGDDDTAMKTNAQSDKNEAAATVDDGIDVKAPSNDNETGVFIDG